MHTYLPFEDYDLVAQCLEINQLHTVLLNCLLILKWNSDYFETKMEENKKHPPMILWQGHELQLAYYALALAREYLENRPLAKEQPSESLLYRKNEVYKWETIIDKLEDLGFPNTRSTLIGDKKFHSGFRSLLLFKGCQEATYQKWRRGEYPDHVSTRTLLPKKSSWKRDDYFRIWEFFGMPESTWYGQFGWKEKPDDLKCFYKEDRKPFMLKEIDRKKNKPVPPYFAGRKTWEDISTQT